MNKDFGRFEIHEKIGSGAMASVYRATQKALDRPVVLKILYPHLAEDEKLVARFEREARAAARLRHENIVQVIDCGRHDDLFYIAMEFVEGSDLKQWMDRYGPPPLETGLLILRDICRGVEHAHQHRIVHRDIKPANIMLTVDGVIKIMDFGLARRAEDSVVMTMHGAVLGTPAYMSPEQANGEALDERSDIFSTGVVGYELLGGARPFGGDTYSTVRHSILTVEPPPLQGLNPLIPTEVVTVIQRMLQKDATKRYPTMDLVRGDLETVIEVIGLHRGRDLVREYAQDPKRVAEVLRSKRLSRHLDQGLFYENMGLGKIDDALLEFRRVLYIDPSNKVAREHVKKLESERARIQALPDREEPGSVEAGGTVVIPPHLIEAEDRRKPGPPPSKPGRAARPVRPDAQSDRIRKLLWASGGALAIVVLAGLIAAGILPPRPRGGTLRITTHPPGARVLLDGRQTPGISNMTLSRISEGSHSIRVEKEGFLPEERSVSARAGRADRLTFVLRELAEGTATLRVTTVPPGARVFLDGAPLSGVTNGTFGELQPGDHRVRIERSGYEPHERLVTLTADKSLELDVTLTRARAQVPTPPAGQTTPPPLELATLRLITVPPDASVWIDGVAQSRRSSVIRNLRPGTHTVRVEKAGYLPAERTITLRKGAEERMTMSLAIPAGAKGVLEIRAIPYATFYVDGQKVRSDVASIRVETDAGRHTVRIVHPIGSQEWNLWVDPGETVRKEHDFIKETGQIRVTSPGNWGHIQLDGKDTGKTTPFTLEYVPKGKHTVTLVHDGFEVEGGPRPVEVKPGETAHIEFKLRRR